MREQLVDFLRHLIAFRTIEGCEEEKERCLDWLDETLLQSISVPRVRGDVGGAPYLYLPALDPKLLWFAHIDVVPAEDHQFDLQIDGDRAVGRGVKDMKGAALPYLFAFAEMARDKKFQNISLLLTSDEETAGASIPHIVQEQLVRGVPVAFTPDNGSDPWIVIGCKGAVWAELICSGKGTHAAFPWQGKNPVFLLSAALQSIRQHFPPVTSPAWDITVTPTQLTGSNAKNKIPDHATCLLDIRYPAERCRSAEEALSTVRAVLPEGCTLRAHTCAEPLSIDVEHPMVQRMHRIAKDITQTDVPFGREHGSSDARYFCAAGIPAFLYGPVGGGLHSIDEWVSITSLCHHYEMAKRLSEELAM